MNELMIPLQKDSDDHLYLQIYNYIKNEIRKGSMPAGQKLPSTRALATHLQVARSTVDFAYGQLLSEGYIESIPYKGHFVCEISGIYQPAEVTVVDAEQEVEEAYLFDFSPNSIDISAFPFDTWRRISKTVFLDEDKDIFALGDARGDFRLRQAICHYLHGSRGVLCTPDQVLVGAGNDYLLMLLQKILGNNHRVAVENPAYMRAARIFASGGDYVCPVELDENGMRVDLLRKSGAEIAYVTPSRQFPTGIVMPVGRRSEILSWANEEEGRFIIEDDYDSEFRYKGVPIPSLQALDRKGKVIYLGTFSKSIAPAIRVSYMVLPPKMVKLYDEKLWFVSSTVSRIDQAILYHFLEEGHFERYLNKMRKLYKGKHDLLLEKLKPFRKYFTISGEQAGLHVILTAKDGKLTEDELLEKAKKQGCHVYCMSHYRLDDMNREIISKTTEQKIAEKPTEGLAKLILGYAALSEHDICEGIERLKTAWEING